MTCKSCRCQVPNEQISVDATIRSSRDGSKSDNDNRLNLDLAETVSDRENELRLQVGLADKEATILRRQLDESTKNNDNLRCALEYLRNKLKHIERTDSLDKALIDIKSPSDEDRTSGRDEGQRAKAEMKGTLECNSDLKALEYKLENKLRKSFSLIQTTWISHSKLGTILRIRSCQSEFNLQRTKRSKAIH